MRKLLFLFAIGYAFTINAQSYYAFSRTQGTYNSITGATTLINGAWTDFVKPIALPFPFKFYTYTITDSIYVDDFGSVSVDDSNGEEFMFFGEDLESRGANLSEVSYKVEGTAPSRILKMQFKNAGLYADGPMFADSINIQVWLYEGYNVIEVRFGPGKIDAANWSDAGPFIGMIDPNNLQSFLLLQGSTSNPTMNTSDLTNFSSLIGLPANGTIYRFTPSQFPNGIVNTSINLTLSQNKISISPAIEVNEIRVINMNGQVLRSGKKAENIDLSNLPHGLYMIAIDTKDGVISRKLIL